MSDTLSKNLERNQCWPYPGSRWWKFDFHTHTPASNDYGKGPNHAALRDINPRDWLLNFMRAGVDCVAVTDHNTGEWIDPLKQALAELKAERPPDFRELYLFPGVEITANGNIHILAILDKDKRSSDINSLLGAVKCRSNQGTSDSASDASPIQVVQAILERGHLPILAHVDNPDSGAWNLSGNTLNTLLELELIAIEVVDTKSDKPPTYRNKNLSLAEVLGSDSHHPNGQSGNRYPGSHYTWIKMSDTPSLEGLRLALLDGQKFSIRRSDDHGTFDPFELPNHYIEKLEISEARYMGLGESAKIELSPWLNAIIGGRGTGKSTVIHSLRLVSRREHELSRFHDQSEPSLTFKRFNRSPGNRNEEGGLRESTSIVWTVMRNGVRHRVIWSLLGNKLLVEENHSNSWIEAGIQTITPERFPIRIFSQGQIAELAGNNSEALLSVIDEAADTASYQKEFSIVQREFETLRTRMRDLDERLSTRDDIEIELQDVNRKLTRFEAAQHAKVLKNYQTRTRQKRELSLQFDNIRDMIDQIINLAKELNLDDIPKGIFDASLSDNQEALSIIDELTVILQSTANNLQTSAQNLRYSTDKLYKKLTKSGWQESVHRADEEHNTLVVELKKEGITDPSEYSRLVQDGQQLDSEIKRLESLQEDYSRLEQQSSLKLERLGRIRRDITSAREIFLNTVLDHNRFVAIKVRPYGYDISAIEHSLREVIGVHNDRFRSDILDNEAQTGIVSDLLAELPNDLNQQREILEVRIGHLKNRIIQACLGKGTFRGHFNNYLERTFKRQPSFLDSILTWFPEDGLMVEYSPKGDGNNFKPISQASAGQRSAAMLAFLLTHGDQPLILDQPEDDLDNHLIYDLVVRQIRESKLNRQIIVVTHNPNVVVNGDAEMVYALEFISGQCKVKEYGSLQEEDIRQEVCRIMEGGREAFERRYQRLGHLPDV